MQLPMPFDSFHTRLFHYFLLRRPCPQQLFAFDFASSSPSSSSSSSHTPRTVGQLIDLLAGRGGGGGKEEQGAARMRRGSISTAGAGLGFGDDNGSFVFPEGCESWGAVSEEGVHKEGGKKNTSGGAQARVTAVPAEVGSRAAALRCLQLRHHVALQVGGATCVSSAIMRVHVASSSAAAAARVASTTTPHRTPLISLFEWTWAPLLPSNSGNNKSGIERNEFVEEDLVLSTTYFEFIFDNLKSTMETLGALHQKVYYSFKKQTGCAGLCMQNHNSHFNSVVGSSSSLPLSSPLEEPYSSHTPLGSTHRKPATGAAGSYGSGGCCYYQEAVVGSVLSYIESTMRDVVGRWNTFKFIY